MILQNRQSLFGDWMRGTPSWFDKGEMVSTKETQLNHIAVPRNTNRKVGRSGRALCGELVLDQDAFNYDLDIIEPTPPIIAGMPKCRACMRVVMSWIADDDSILASS